MSNSSGALRCASAASARLAASPSSAGASRRDRRHFAQVAVAVEHDVAAGRKRGAAALGDRAGQRLHRDVVAHQQALESR